MRKVIILLMFYSTIVLPQTYKTFLEDSVRFKGKIISGTPGGSYDVNLYRGDEDLLKTDDNFSSNSLQIQNTTVITNNRKLQNVWIPRNSIDTTGLVLAGSGNPNKVWKTDASGSPGWRNELTNVPWENITNKPVKLTDFLSGNISVNGYTISNTTSEIVVNANGSVSFNFNNGSTGNLSYYGGSTSSLWSVDNSGNMGLAGNFNMSGDLIADDIVWVNEITADHVTANTTTIGDLTLTGNLLSSSDVSIKPANNSSLAIGYTKTGVDLILYNNTTVVHSVQETGAGYFASTVDAAAYKVAGSPGTAGQVLVSNGTTGGVWSSVPGTLTDGDKGDITVSNSGALWTIDNAAVVITEISGFPSQAGNSGKFLTTNGSTLSWASGGGGGIATALYDDLQENTFTASDLLKIEDNLSDLSNAADARENLGLGTVATLSYPGGTSNFLRADGTWAAPLVPAPSFSTIINGTASGKNFLIGSGSVLDYTSGGIINASHLGGISASGYLTGNQTITLTGDVTGSGSTSINVTVADNSHSHLWANITDKPSSFTPSSHTHSYSDITGGIDGQVVVIAIDGTHTFEFESGVLVDYDFTP